MKIRTAILAASTCGLAGQSHARADSIVNGIFTPTPTNTKFAYVGMDDGWQERLEQIPGVRFLDASGQVREAFQTMESAGLNAVRVTVDLGQPLASAPLTGTAASDEAAASSYTLDYGGVDLQVDIARRAKASGMKIVLTIDMGPNIPGPGHEPYGNIAYDHWETDNYAQMLTDIQAETVRLLDPFLQAGVRPDIIVAGDETDGGMLSYASDSNGDRSLGNPVWTLQTLAASDVATGDDTVYPKFVGFEKTEIMAAKQEVSTYFGSASPTLYALHSKGGSTSWYYGRMFSSAPLSETVASWNGQNVPVTAVQNATLINTLPPLADMVDILGSSYYFGTPTAGTQAAFSTAFLNAGNDEAMPQVIQDLESWGLADNLSSDGSTYVSGPYQGEPAKRYLVMETDTGLNWTSGSSSGTVPVAVQQQFINYCFQQIGLAANQNLVLGAMWWEGEYGEFTHDASLFPLNPGTLDHQASPSLLTWGQYGQLSPNIPFALENVSDSLFLTGGQWLGSWSSLQSLVPQTAQTFHVAYNPGADSTTLINDREGGLLGVWNDSQGSGGHVELTPPAEPPQDYQQWRFVSNGSGSNQLIDVGSGLAMDIPSPVQDAPNAGSLTQQWMFTPLQRFNIVNVANGLVLDSGLGSVFAGQYTGLQQRPNNTVVSQQFSIVSDYNANLGSQVYYRIMSFHIVDTNGNQPFLLAPWNDSTVVDDHVEQTTLAASGILPGQEWALTPATAAGQTAYRITNRNSGLALDAPAGPAIQAPVDTSSQTQLWMFVPSD